MQEIIFELKTKQKYFVCICKCLLKIKKYNLISWFDKA